MTLICIDTCGERVSLVKTAIRDEIQVIIDEYGLDPKNIDVCLFAHKLYSNLSYDMFMDDETLDYVLTGRQPVDYQRFFNALTIERGDSDVENIFILTDNKAFEESFSVQPWIEEATAWVIDNFNGIEPDDNGQLFGEIRYYNYDGFDGGDSSTEIEESANTVNDDRKLVEELVKKYGTKDVITFVSSINEGKNDKDPKDEKNIYLGAFKRINRQALVWLCKFVDGEMGSSEKKLVKDALHTAMMASK